MTIFITFAAAIAAALVSLGVKLGLMRLFAPPPPAQAAVNTERQMAGQIINPPDQSVVERKLDNGTF